LSKFLRYEACPKCQDRGADRAGDNRAVYADDSKHCFACGAHTFAKHYKRVYEEIDTKDKAKLPYDFSREIPSRAWRWLLAYGLSWRYWQEHCGYSEAESRLIFKVGEPFDFSIGRYIPPDEGTSDVPIPRKWHVYGNSHERSHLFGPYEEAKQVILVEDLISAHKVGAAGHLVLPLFGTNIHACHLKQLRELHLPIIMWLDNDQKSMAIQRCNRLSILSGLPCKYVFTENDAKLLSIKDINSVLQN
jgi:hypothetical protein